MLADVDALTARLSPDEAATVLSFLTEAATAMRAYATAPPSSQNSPLDQRRPGA